ncbi:MAG: RdgB/HAM1 family non-canonical purine NTP pyrophosphatase [Chthoniobacterales bacterium]
MHQLLLATRNPHKMREFAEILGPQFNLSDLAKLPEVPVVEETGRTFEENAILKALAVSRPAPGLVVADDSGLEVAALGGDPGVYSARYASASASDEQNVAKLLSRLQQVDPDRRNPFARFCCVLALASAGKLLRIFSGTVAGLIVSPARGKSGFGYDPVFVPEGFTETFAELGAGEKNRISHRARAIAQLRDYLSGKSAAEEQYSS